MLIISVGYRYTLSPLIRWVNELFMALIISAVSKSSIDSSVYDELSLIFLGFVIEEVLGVWVWILSGGVDRNAAIRLIISNLFYYL